MQEIWVESPDISSIILGKYLSGQIFRFWSTNWEARYHFFTAATNEKPGFVYFWTIKLQIFSPCCSLGYFLSETPPRGEIGQCPLNNLDMNPKLQESVVLLPFPFLTPPDNILAPIVFIPLTNIFVSNIFLQSDVSCTESSCKDHSSIQIEFEDQAVKLDIEKVSYIIITSPLPPISSRSSNKSKIPEAVLLNVLSSPSQRELYQKLIQLYVMGLWSFHPR